MTLNAFIDSKSGHNLPVILDLQGGPASALTDLPLVIMPIFLGAEMVGQASGVYRFLTISPIIGQNLPLSTVSTVQVTLSRTRPVASAFVVSSSLQVSFNDVNASYTWTVSQQNYYAAPAQQFAVAKDVLGMAWITVQLTGLALFAGFSQLSESIRTPP